MNGQRPCICWTHQLLRLRNIGPGQCLNWRLLRSSWYGWQGFRKWCCFKASGQRWICPPIDVRIIIAQVTASWSFLDCAGLQISLVTKGAVTAGPVAIVNDDPYNFFQTMQPPDNRVHGCQLLGRLCIVVVTKNLVRCKGAHSLEKLYGLPQVGHLPKSFGLTSRAKNFLFKFGFPRCGGEIIIGKIDKESSKSSAETSRDKDFLSSSTSHCVLARF